MRAFVTGGTGFLGQHLIRELLDHGYAVTALVRTYERARQLPAGVRAVPGDITQPASVRPGLNGADVVFHLAALTTVGLAPRDRERMARITVEGTRWTLTQAAEAGVARIVHVSDVAVHGDTYGQLADESWPGAARFETEAQRAKHAAHYQAAAALQAQGAPVIIASPGAAYGPGDRAGLGRRLAQQQRGRLWLLLGPEGARAWTYADDIAAGLRLAAERGRPGEHYHLAGPAHTLRDVLTLAAQLGQRPAPLAWLPAALAIYLARAAARLQPAWADQWRAQGPATYLAHSSKARRELGWTPRPLADGLPPTLAWLKDTS